MVISGRVRSGRHTNKVKKLQDEKLREKSIMIRQNFESEEKGHIPLRQKREKE